MAASFEHARNLVLENIAPLDVESIPLLDALGCALAEDVIAPVDMPRWNNSAMDGFAVRAEDCQQPATLTVTGYIPAGATAEGLEVKAGTAVKIMTGAPAPAGCTAIVPIEETSETEGAVHIHGKVERDDHIRFQGEDVKAGEAILSDGTVLRPPEISLLASLGSTSVPVHRKPRVAILSTGDELVEPGEAVGPGQLINSNSLALAAAIKELGAEPALLGIARDNRESLTKQLQEGLAADVLITSAGVSAGDCDLVRDVLAEFGVEQLFWGVDIKPGKPTAFALNRGKPVFSLPGNPVSTMVTFEEFVRPALLKMMGHRRLIKPTFKARLLEATRKKAGRTQFLRVRVARDGDSLTAVSAGDQHTGIVRTLVEANGIALLPAEPAQIEAGELVDIHLIDVCGSHYFDELPPAQR